jgi:hypothetical protein
MQMTMCVSASLTSIFLLLPFLINQQYLFNFIFPLPGGSFLIFFFSPKSPELAAVGRRSFSITNDTVLRAVQTV